MRRREFISLIGGVAVAWPLAARAQQSNRVRVIGSLNILAEDDPEEKLRMAAFKQSLQQLGWTEGSNVRIEVRSQIRGRTVRDRARCRLEFRQRHDRTSPAGAPHRANRIRAGC
jgi:hypothetical protein